jgi:hypothetical protein
MRRTVTSRRISHAGLVEQVPPAVRSGRRWGSARTRHRHELSDRVLHPDEGPSRPTAGLLPGAAERELRRAETLLSRWTDDSGMSRPDTAPQQRQPGPRVRPRHADEVARDESRNQGRFRRDHRASHRGPETPCRPGPEAEPGRVRDRPPLVDLKTISEFSPHLRSESGSG